MSDSREVLAMRNRLQSGLTDEEIRDINWRALADATANAIDRGWTGDEIGRWVLGDIGGTLPVSIGAVALTTIRHLATIDPPRPDATPTPPSIVDVRAGMYARHVPATPEQASAWVARIKAELPRREEVEQPT